VVVGMAHNGSPAERSRPPQAFLKSARTITDPDTPIGLDDHLGQIHVETELAVVIRRTSHNLSAADVAAAILGYTIGNDITAVDQIPLDEVMTQAKNGDGFTPIRSIPRPPTVTVFGSTRKSRATSPGGQQPLHLFHDHDP
jgi:2-keto-4-pentenoate hydratase/2-oxohepta-3-ene-1,7-dioic acid hydratase in catechol pathway